MSEVVEEIRKVFGNEPFTAEDLINSDVPIASMWSKVAYALARIERGAVGVSISRSVGRHLATTDGLESLGRNRGGASIWRIKP
jgi:hypothetical protein